MIIFKKNKELVLEFMKSIYGSNRNVTMDNFFTSILLAKELQTRKLTQAAKWVLKYLLSRII
jgi:hypothetical protein